MEELISLANKLAGATLATLLFVILAGSRLRVWRWNQDFLDLEARHKHDLEREKSDREAERMRLEDERNWWRDRTVQTLGLAETQATVLRVKETKERRRVEGVNTATDRKP